MDIAGLSIDMSQARLMNEVSTAMLANTLDAFEMQGAGMAELMEVMPTIHDVCPDIGGNIDLLI